MINNTVLKQCIQQIEHGECEKQDAADHIKDIYDRLKGEGFDVKIVRQVIKRRKMDAAEVNEQDEMLELYEKAVQVV